MDRAFEKRSLPAWAMALCVLVSVTISLVIGSAFYLCIWARQISQDSSKPEYMLKTAARIANFPQPLPAGYAMKTAVDLPDIGFEVLVIEHQSDKQDICFMLTKDLGDDKPEEVLDKVTEGGINTAVYIAKFQEMKSHGQVEVAGQKMPYIVGRFKDYTGRTCDGMVACVIVKGSAKNILIYAFPTTETPYNQESALDLIESIKSF